MGDLREFLRRAEADGELVCIPARRSSRPGSPRRGAGNRRAGMMAAHVEAVKEDGDRRVRPVETTNG